VQSDSGAGFPLLFRFSMLIMVSPTASYSFITWGWSSRPTIGRRAKSAQCHPLHELKNTITVVRDNVATTIIKTRNIYFSGNKKDKGKVVPLLN
jgi:hypothetical protein